VLLMSILQLVINDFLQTMMHYGEHKVSPAIYKVGRAMNASRKACACALDGKPRHYIVVR
jgi:hypothetical protein